MLRFLLYQWGKLDLFRVELGTKILRDELRIEYNWKVFSLMFKFLKVACQLWEFDEYDSEWYEPYQTTKSELFKLKQLPLKSISNTIVVIVISTKIIK